MFDIAERIPDTTVVGDNRERRRRADCYVFALFTATEHRRANPLDLEQWEFCVVKVGVLPHRKSISLSLVHAMERDGLIEVVPFDALRGAVGGAVASRA